MSSHLMFWLVVLLKADRLPENHGLGAAGRHIASSIPVVHIPSMRRSAQRAYPTLSLTESGRDDDCRARGWTHVSVKYCPRTKGRNRNGQFTTYVLDEIINEKSSSTITSIIRQSSLIGKPGGDARLHLLSLQQKASLAESALCHCYSMTLQRSDGHEIGYTSAYPARFLFLIIPVVRPAYGGDIEG